MIADKKTTLKALLESDEGIHLTGYLINRSDLVDFKRQLDAIKSQAQEFLRPVMSDEQARRFLEPLEALRNDSRIFGRMKGNIGIFRTTESFRVLNVPVDVEESCVVASTFHVKPLLRWMQADPEFFLLGLEKETAHIYLGSQQALTHIDSVLCPVPLPLPPSVRASESGLRGSNRRDVKIFEANQADRDSWLNDWISSVVGQSKHRMFVAGDEQLTRNFFVAARYPNLLREPIHSSFREELAPLIAQNARMRIKSEVIQKLERTLFVFRVAEDMNLTKRNIFQIAKAAVRGQVRKLIVADGIKIFGKLDPKSGGLAIHPCDLDHEDDDLLDDLAQTVLSQGGEVVVAARSAIPKGRPVMAILERDPIASKSLALDIDDLVRSEERRSV